MQKTLLQNPLTRDILSLLMISSISDLEKQVWLEVLPELSEEDKLKLRENLKKEVAYEKTVAEEQLKNFISALEAQ